MSLIWFVLGGAALIVVIQICISKFDPEGKSGIAQDFANHEHGTVNPYMNCPHCLRVGKVRTKKILQKKGMSGGKATAAILTGGVSLLGTGLSRKEELTQAFCGECKNIWTF
ncbi:MAG: hypothetical protein V4614_16800 [Pseudomonadota bacterium]